jgi:pyruvate dehydrogenase (quinone)
VLGQIRWEQMIFLGNPEYGVELHPIDFVKYAEACGGTGFRIDDPKRAAKILDKAFATEGPVLIEAIVDPYEPPMPAQITPKQAVELSRALVRGEPNRVRIGETIFRDKVTDFTAAQAGNGHGPLAVAKTVLRHLTDEEKLES